MYVARLSVLVASSCIAASAFGQASFTPIGDLAGGAFYSEALGISSDGTKVVGLGSDASGGTKAVLWSAGTLTTLIDTSGVYTPTMAYAIAANGVIVGEATGPSGAEAFKYNTSGANRFRALGGVTARGVSASGAVVVGRRETASFTNEAARWDGPAITGLGFFDSEFPASYALGISSNGNVVVGGADTAEGIRAFAIYNNEGFLTPLDVFGADQSEAFGASANGAVIVGNGRINSFLNAVRWTNGAAQILPAISGFTSTTATSCSADGSVVVGHGLGSGPLQALVWRGNQAATIKEVLASAGVTGLGAWRLATAYGVSADGKWVCGTGEGPRGFEGWIARLPDLAPPCAVDFNGDGFLDFFDYDDYVTCFETASCPPGKTADYNGDQFVDFFDYDDFVAAFEAGC